ncbi:hypothetical protein RYX36_026331 [Vicia faba]
MIHCILIKGSRKSMRGERENNVVLIHKGESEKYDMRNSMMENNNNDGFSWDGDNKLDSLFQFQVNAIKSEDFGTSSWEQGQIQTHNSIDFNSYPLTSL